MNDIFLSTLKNTTAENFSTNKDELIRDYKKNMRICSNASRYSCLQQYNQPFMVALIIVIVLMLVVYIFVLNDGKLIIRNDDGTLHMGRTAANFAALGAGIFGVGYFMNSLRCYVSECDYLRNEYRTLLKDSADK